MLLGTLFSCLFLFGLTKGGYLDSRLSIIKDKQPNPNHKHARIAFSNVRGQFRCAEWFGGAAHESWSTWSDLGSPTPVFSNPVAVHDKNNLIHVFVQGDDGQVLSLTQKRGKTGCASLGHWAKVATNSLPFQADALRGIIGKDSINVVQMRRDSNIYIFSRSYSKPSGLYLTIFDGITFTPWKGLGGDLVSDVTVVDNAYTHYLEAFAFFRDGKIHRIWQWKDRSWSSWTSMSYGQPAFVTTSRPVAMEKSANFFNGRTEVFALGKDGRLRHCFQTTCDMVNNAWGLCTWSWWYKIDRVIPPLLSYVNALSVGSNIHGGHEVFMIGKDHRVWRTWQMQKGSKWNNWGTMGQPIQNVGSLPLVDEDLWWGVHFEDDKYSKIVSVRQNRSMVVYPGNVGYGGAVAIFWDVPLDESSEKDWVGIFRRGTGNDDYLDYRYVNGKLNPGRRPVPQGKVGMKLFLPKGSYEVRYIIGGGHVNVFQKDIASNSSSTRSKWMQLFIGLNRGLGREGLTEPDCVDDGDMLVAKFELAFAAFINKDYHRGLSLLGSAIHVMYKTLLECGELNLAYKILSFAKDLIECTVDLCIGLVIDLSSDVYILYKARYEIYWDIRAAINAFKMGAYEQGAMSIGHVIRDALGLPDVSIIKDAIIDDLLEEGWRKMIEIH